MAEAVEIVGPSAPAASAKMIATNSAPPPAPAKPLMPLPKSFFVFTISSILCLAAAAVHSNEDSQLCVEVGFPNANGVVDETCLNPHSFLVIWFTIVILLALANDIAPDIVLIFFTALFTVIPMECLPGKNLTPGAEEPVFGCRIVKERDAWIGFSNPAIIAAATLLVYARCLEETRVVELMITPCLALATNEVTAVALLAYPTFFFSSFLNSTPIVAMLIPVCEAWCAKTGFKLRTVLMPLSFSAMLGGLTSLVGTASNMVLVGLIQQDPTPPLNRPFGFMDQAMAGVPAAIVALAVLSFAAPILLRKKSDGDEGGRARTESTLSGASGRGNSFGDEGSFSIVEMNVQRGYELEATVTEGFLYMDKLVSELETMQPIEGMVNESDLKSTKNLSVYSSKQANLELNYVKEGPIRVEALIRSDGSRFDRSDRALDDTRVQLGDKLYLSCAAIMFPALRRMEGLTLAPEEASADLAKAKTPRALFQAVLSKRSPLVDLRVSMATEHPSLANKALWGVRRGGQSGAGAHVDAVLQPEDTLLIEADEDFEIQRENNSSFLLVTMVPGSKLTPVNPLESFQFYSSILSLIAMVVVSIGNTQVPFMPILPLSFFLAFYLIAIGCITPEQAWMSIKYRVILTIMAAFGLGTALENTGVSAVIAKFFEVLGNAMGGYPYLLLIFHVTAMLSWLVGSTPAIILLYNSVSLLDKVAGVRPNQALLALMLGAVCAMATPVGFATNLMVQGIAGYKFADFVALGALTTVVVGVVSCSIILVMNEDVGGLPPLRDADKRNQPLE